jgi:hypothetical protein
MGPEFGQQPPAHVLCAYGPQSLLTGEDEVETQKFESEARAIAIGPREKAVQIFVNLLTELAK